MATSLITSEIDFTSKSKQAGYLRLPHSVHRSAYGWIPVPVTMISNGDGPTLLLIAGVHGDEYEGQIALSRLAQDLRAEDVQGRVIILPQANLPACDTGTRVSPLDQGNMNRLFPGKAAGGPTEIMAHYIESELMPLADYAVDLHSGGGSLFYEATLLRGLGHTDAEKTALMNMQTAFDLPYAWVFTSGGGTSSTGRTAMAAANRNGVPCVMAELGGGGEVTPEILAQTERGLRRIMHGFGMLPGYDANAPNGTREARVLGSVYAYAFGLLEMLKDIGDDVDKDEVIALIHRVDTPLSEPIKITAPYSGFILCKRAMAQVRRGDAVAQIAADLAL